MSTKDKHRNKKTLYQADTMDYQSFLKENQKNVNLLLNKFLRFSILTGPLLVLLLRLGIFRTSVIRCVSW